MAKTTKPFIFGQDGLIPLPNLIAVKDLECRFVALTDSIKNRIGFKNVDDVIGITDRNINCASAQFAEHFISQDQNIMANNQPKKFMDCYFNENNEPILSIADKAPVVQDGVVKGISISIIEMDFTSFSECSTWLIKNITDKKAQSPNQQYNFFEIGGLLSSGMTLSDRQQEVLFLLLRGNRSNEIAEKLFLSKRTIEDHINGLKDKFNCLKKTDLIEKAINEGYLNLLPSRFYRQLL